MSEVPMLLADNPGRQQIVDAVHELELLYSAYRILHPLTNSTGRSMDPDLLGETLILRDTIRDSGHFTAGEVGRGVRWLEDLIDGGHEYGLWPRIRREDLDQQWSDRIRIGDIPVNWRSPYYFPDAELLPNIGFATSPTNESPVTENQFDRMFSRLAAHVATGPSTPEKEAAWRKAGMVAAEEINGLLREGLAGLNAGQTYRASLALSALYQQERLIDTSGTLISPKEVINSDTVCSDWLTARHARLISGDTTATGNSISMNRSEFRSIVQLIDQQITEQPLSNGALTERVEFWDSMTSTVSHLQHAALIPGLLRDDAERERASIWLQGLADGGGLPTAAWSLIADATESGYVEPDLATKKLSQLNNKPHAYLIDVLRDLSYHATRHRATNPDQPLPSALTIETKQILATARNRLDYDTTHTAELQNITVVVESMLSGGDPRYMAERVQHEPLMRAWRETTPGDSDWVSRLTQPGMLLAAPHPTTIPTSPEPVSDLEVAGYCRPTRTEPAPAVGGKPRPLELPPAQPHQNTSAADTGTGI
ncbi:hypothetical protein ACL02S_22235 [Nocardia sp. 004]|uniref:hypothetical protein n=1 Tax=Nocardia sp. 004 TaxID=3385978 RepID=UPI0039A0214B